MNFVISNGLLKSLRNTGYFHVMFRTHKCHHFGISSLNLLHENLVTIFEMRFHKYFC